MSSLFRKKSLDQLMLESQTKRLSRSLNTFDLILLGIGCVVGTGIFVITGVARRKMRDLRLLYLLFWLRSHAPLLLFATLNFPRPFQCQEVSIRIFTQHLENSSPF